jgi:hypothetical protein
MRFYILPPEPDKTTCINFDHVARIIITKTSIEVYYVGLETPTVLAKNVATLNQVAKGMDLSDSTKEQIIKL